MNKHIEQIEEAVLELKKQIAENEHTGRICPDCGQKTLSFKNKEYSASSGGDYVTGETSYISARKLVAVCTNCGWKYEDQDFIKECLHKL